MIIKLQWKPKKSTEAPFEVEVPDVLHDPKALEDCGRSCHVAVKAKDYIFHLNQKR